MNSTYDRISNVVGEQTNGRFFGKRNSELKRFVDDVEELLTSVSHLDDADVARMRGKLEDSLSVVRDSLSGSTARVKDASVRAATNADKYAHERPWAVAGLAAVAALALGAAIAGRR
jgi:ElaB/YqjD/DUF883 family membrane-anchored ribosome-binding protein